MASVEVVTLIQPESLLAKGIPWWVILLAVLGGLLLLGLLAYGLYKVRLNGQDFPSNLSDNQYTMIFAPSKADSKVYALTYLILTGWIFQT